MSGIDAALVRELRERTGAGMMDCKRALAESSGNMDAAADWLRAKGLVAAAKRASRVAAEGLVAVVAKGTKGVVVEVNSETDFVARNDQFQGMVRSIAEVALGKGGDHTKTAAAPYPGGKATVAEKVAELVGSIGENLQFRRARGLSVNKGVIASYVHNSVAPGMGKIGVLVGLESAGDSARLMAFGRQLAMHVAAANPQSVTVADLDPAVVEKERAVLAEQAKDSGKPADIVAKMIDGRLRKFYGDVVLVEQLFVIDNETKVAKAVEDAAKDIGAPVRVSGFVRFELGEGIEKKQTDFAAEVAAAQTQTRR